MKDKNDNSSKDRLWMMLPQEQVLPLC
jgi:hypothetical protein